ncbi:MAG: hypothetical protein KatS3mg057_2694 [Herpetosiphonaceae bacterium]|nr:MAG: hypothetical protein KatS3mg057_2694 [Herpetosiphonaceae bacterium]
MRYYLSIRLLSDATFGRGEGVPGLVDVEIDHDEAGCPMIDGRTIKGLLLEEWLNLRSVLRHPELWEVPAACLFGRRGATGDGRSLLHIGAATLPPELRAALHESVRMEKLQPDDVLRSLTTIRRQTAIDATTGAPETGSLRAMRVLLRETQLVAELDFEKRPDDRTLALLAACALAVRRGGAGRNRGRGRMSLLLHPQLPSDVRDETFTRQCFEQFAREVVS